MLGYGLLGLAGVAALGAGAWYLAMRNVEQPAYDVVERDGAIEIRDYPALVVAEVARRGDREEGVRAGFRALAAFIFAKDRPGDKIAMTAPVTQARTAAETGDGWVVRFIMPSRHTLDTLPAPSGDVRLKPVAAARRAAIRFSGSWSDARFAEKEARLRAWLEQRGHRPEGPPILAYYNDPFTPPPLRRNEVMFDLSVISGE